MLKVFIGYDSREPIAYHVLAHSIVSRASSPVAIIPLVQSQLRAQGLYTRERNSMEATEFSMTRFLVPYLSGYQGVSIFMDCDMLCLTNLSKLPHPLGKSVSVCKHDYTPKGGTKMEGQAQTSYPRKNWSSFMVFNNEGCRALTPGYVNSATGLQLHRFQWLEDPQIGSLPLEYNWLLGEYPINPEAKVLHYTLGGPWFDAYHACDGADEWRSERDRLLEPTLPLVYAP